MDSCYILAVDHFLLAKFYVNVHANLTDRSFIYPITHKLGLYFYLKKHFKNTRLVKRAVTAETTYLPYLCKEFKLNRISVDQFSRLSTSFENTLNTIPIENYKKSYTLIWNGHRASDIPAINWSLNNNSVIIYLELSNIPGYMFCSRCGVNAKSSIYYNPNQIRNYDFDEEQYALWRSGYQQYLINKSQKPKQVKAQNRVNSLSIIDHVGVSLCVTPRGDDLGVIDKLKRKFRRFEYDVDDLLPEKYIFFPIQVSDDSQILFNSKYGLISSIKEALSIANKQSLPLVVKFHPGERDSKTIESIANFCKANAIYISRDETCRLIQNCVFVITINSTVGFEASILNKNVSYLGESIYQAINVNDYGRYIFGYLLKFDFFEPEPNYKKFHRHLEQVSEKE